MGYSLRDYIALLEQRGELVEVNEEVDWCYELYGFANMAGRVSGPALLFNRIKDIAEGKGRVLTGYFVGTIKNPHRRICLAVGIDPDLPYVDAVDQVMAKMGTPLKPVEVATGPVKEVIKLGKEVNLLEFPFIFQSPIDGGRYQLANIVIIKDPDSDWINWGNYACMIGGRNRVAISAGPGGDFSMIYRKYASKGESIPAAIVIGGDPAISLMGGALMPPGISEADIAGGLRGAPMELVRAETSDLLVPADAEMVLEGEFRPGELMMEGPKPEWYGFASGPRGPAYAMRVHCVTYRPNPILPTIAHVSSSMTDLEATFTVTIPPSINAFCRMTGLPIKQGNITGSKWCGYSFLLSTKDWYPGYARDLYERILAMPGFHIYADEVRLVDDDVNIARPEMVIDALYNQRNPARDMWFTDRETPTGVLYRVYWEREDFQRESAFMSALSAGIASNCLTKGDPPLGVRRCGFETLLPEETQRWVMDNWQKWGFKEEPYWNKAYEELKPIGMGR